MQPKSQNNDIGILINLQHFEVICIKLSAIVSHNPLNWYLLIPCKRQIKRLQSPFLDPDKILTCNTTKVGSAHNTDIIEM